MYKSILKNKTYTFPDLKTLFAKASPKRSGDILAGVAADGFEERVAACLTLSNIYLIDIIKNPIIPYEKDEVTRLICDKWDMDSFSEISHLTVGGFRDFLLSEKADQDFFQRIRLGITPEIAAAVSKIMRNQDLVLVSSKIEVVTKFRNTIGLRGRFSTRLQPNHPTDDPKGIMASIIDGLYYASGDAVIGINPATDNLENVCRLNSLLDEFRSRYEIPTQTCILTHITNSIEAIDKGYPVDLVFQSIGGTEKTNQSFGINLSILKEGYEAAKSLARGSIGQNAMYFETGQGSSLSANANEDLDQQTCEVRAYAVAREFQPLLVNSVVGFIGPEYLYNGKEIIRAGLEDHFCGKLLGLPMGVDICYTNHADADQDDMDTLLTILGTAGCNFIMGIPGADDIMLNYQSTSFHDALYLRSLLNKRPAPEFESWLENWKIFDREKGLLPHSDSPRLLMDLNKKDPTMEILSSLRVKSLESEKMDSKQIETIPKDPWRVLKNYTDARIGLGRTGQSLPTREYLAFQLAHAGAKDALLKEVDPDLFTKQLKSELGLNVPVLYSQAQNLNTYLQRPDLGRKLSSESENFLQAKTSPRIAIVITDGLSGQAVEENATSLLKLLVPSLINTGLVKENEIQLYYLKKGRVGISDPLGKSLNAELVLLLVGERPGLSSPNSMGAYITYKPNPGYTDEMRNCISNIRPDGLRTDKASEKILYLISEALDKKLSGVQLKDRSGIEESIKLISPTKVKLCGLRDPEIATFSVVEGTDYLGINLSPKSKRRVSPEIAIRLANEVRLARDRYSMDTKIVLLFYNNTSEEIFSISQIIQPDLVQLIYGDPELDKDWKIYRENFNLLPVYPVQGILGNDDIPFPPTEIPILDTPSSGKGGGTGESFPWERLKNVDRKYFLAGGLGPENVESAIRILHPWGVDVASGIEDESKNQSRIKIREFIRNAKR